MALSIDGTPACVAATSITLPTHAIGDILEVAAYRNGSTSAPTVPGSGGTVPAWSTIDSAGANLNAMVVVRFVATATNHTSGTFTNATHMAAINYSNGDQVTVIGGHAQGGTANATGVIDLNNGAVTLVKTDGTSAIVRYVGARTVTAWGSAPSGWTLQASVVSSGGIAILTKNSTTSEDSSGDNFNNTFSGNGGFRVQGVEVLAGAVAGGETQAGFLDLVGVGA